MQWNNKAKNALTVSKVLSKFARVFSSR